MAHVTKIQSTKGDFWGIATEDDEDWAWGVYKSPQAAQEALDLLEASDWTSVPETFDWEAAGFKLLANGDIGRG